MYAILSRFENVALPAEYEENGARFYRGKKRFYNSHSFYLLKVSKFYFCSINILHGAKELNFMDPGFQDFAQLCIIPVFVDKTFVDQSCTR